MNHQFLIRPAQLNQEFESNSSSGGGEGSDVTRRSFIKRTGGATVATLVAWNLSTANAKASPPGDDDHCSFHGSYCTWITDLKAHFTSASPADPEDYPNATISGRVFYGNVTYKHHYCDPNFGPPKEITIPAKTGGYINAASRIPQPDPDANPPIDNDTACPAKKYWYVTPSTSGDPDELIGFPIEMSSTGRGSILIHTPGRSEGCIVLDDEAQASIFYKHIRCHNWPEGEACIHPECKNPVPIEVSYAEGVTPHGNEPGPG